MHIYPYENLLNQYFETFVYFMDNYKMSIFRRQSVWGIADDSLIIINRLLDTFCMVEKVKNVLLVKINKWCYKKIITDRTYTSIFLILV